MSKRFVNPSEFIVPININGMEGRMLRVNSQNRHNHKEILVIYDLQSNLEKWWGLAVALKRDANVTLIDLPGLGGMDSFYSIGLKPSIDNMADYIAAYIKLKFKRKRLSIIGIGFGFSLVTRMLQNNPDIENKVNLLVCINSYAHKDDFIIKNSDRKIMKLYSYVCSTRVVSKVLSMLFLNTPILRLKYPLDKIKTTKKGPSKEFIRQFKIDIDRFTDLRTKMYLKKELLNLDNCKARVKKPVWHITTSNSDQRVDLNLVEQHFKIIFDSYNQIPTKIKGTMPMVLNDDKVAVKYLPAKIRRLLKAEA